MKEYRTELIDWSTYIVFPILVPFFLYRWIVIGFFLVNGRINCYLEDAEQQFSDMLKEKYGDKQ